jgi:hypothetical protein
MAEKHGLYYNINKRRKEGLPPKKPGQEGYPTKQAFIDSAKTAKKEEVEHKVDEAYKAIDKKKENAMYRRAGNLARTSLSSRGAKKADAQKKSSNIVSAIARQKENERFSKMADEKARSNYNESLEKARDNVGADKCWDGYKAKGTKKKNGRDVPNCVKEGKSLQQFMEDATPAWQRKEGKTKTVG